MSGSKRRRARALVGVIALGAGALLSSCSTSGYQYLHDADTRTYFKVPERWTVFDQRQLFPQQAAGAAGAPASPGAAPGDPMLWAVGFNEEIDRSRFLLFKPCSTGSRIQPTVRLPFSSLIAAAYRPN